MTGLSSSAGPIPVTVAGYGGSANTFHLPFLLALPQHFQLFSIQQRPGPDKPDIKQRFPQIHVHPTPEEIFHPQPGGPPRLPEGGLVVITLINRLHFSTARLALENGCHVLCEKPLTLSSQEVKELQDLAQQKGLVCYTFQSTYNACNAVPLSLHRRFDADFLTLQSYLPPTSGSDRSSLSVAGLERASDSIGVPLYFESHFDRFRPLSKGGWREEVPPSEGGGMLWDLGSHLVDQAVSLFGAPKQVLGLVRNARGQQPPEVDDDFEVHLFYSSAGALPSSSPAANTTPAGLHCRLSASVLAPFTSDQMLRFNVQGTRGSFVSYGLDPQEAQLKNADDVLQDAFGRHASGQREGQATVTLLGEKERTRDFAAQPVVKAQPPPLEASRVDMLQGRYKSLYLNLAQTIGQVNRLPPGEASGRNAAVAQNQAVSLAQVEMAIKVLELARASAQQGRVLDF